MEPIKPNFLDKLVAFSLPVAGVLLILSIAFNHYFKYLWIIGVSIFVVTLIVDLIYSYKRYNNQNTTQTQSVNNNEKDKFHEDMLNEVKSGFDNFYLALKDVFDNVSDFDVKRQGGLATIDIKIGTHTASIKYGKNQANLMLDLGQATYQERLFEYKDYDIFYDLETDIMVAVCEFMDINEQKENK